MEIDHSAFGSLMSWMLRFNFQTLKVFLILLIRLYGKIYTTSNRHDGIGTSR
jgi:hypothetical protein